MFVGNLDVKDKAIRGSTEKAVLAYSIHLSELILDREEVLSLTIKSIYEKPSLITPPHSLQSFLIKS